MPDPLTENRALRHLLGELSVAETEAFEKQLAEDPESAHELRLVGQDLTTWVETQTDAVPPRPALWEAIATALPDTEDAASHRKTHRFPLWFWQSAALFLLGLNLLWAWLAWNPFESSALAVSSQGISSEPPPLHRLANGEGGRNDALPDSVAALQSALLGERERTAQWEAAHLEATVRLTAEVATNRKLRDELTTWVEHATLTLRERDRLEARLEAFFTPGEGRAQLTLLELRPRGQTTDGWVEHIQDVILDPQQQIAQPSPAPSTPVPFPEEAFNPGVDFDEAMEVADSIEGVTSGSSWTQNPTNPSIPSVFPWSSDQPAPAPPPPADTQPPATADAPATPEPTPAPTAAPSSYAEADTAPPPGTTAVATPSDPAALAVWRDDLGQGYLNLYGLPAIADGGGQYHLWAQNAGDGGYIPVGILPVGSEGTVLLDFTVEVEGFHPAALLLTQETDPEATTPTGPVILATPGG